MNEQVWSIDGVTLTGSN